MYQDAGTGAAAPAPVQKKSGCWKWGCIGCGGLTIIILILLIIVGGIFMKKASVPFKEFMADPKAGIVKLTTYPIKMAIMDALPEGVEPEEAQIVMEEFWGGVIEGRVDGEDADRLGKKFQAAFQDGVLDPDESEELLQFMRDAAGMDEDPFAEEAPQEEEEGWEADESAATAEDTATEL